MQRGKEPNREHTGRWTSSLVSYHEVEIGPGEPFQIDHPEDARVLPIGGEYIGGGDRWMLKYVVITPLPRRTSLGRSCS